MDERPSMERVVSTDLVMDTVMIHLKVGDLLSCRQVCKLWNKAASSDLRRRSTRIKDIEDETDLVELEKCMNQSSDFPFAGLKFPEPWNLHSLRTTVQDLAQFVNHLPRLAIFEACYADGYLESAAGQKGGRILKLPSFRIFRTSSELGEDVLRQVLKAASPSLRIECLGANYAILTALKNTGKLQALSVLKVLVYIDSEYTLRVDELFSTGPPMLAELAFEAGGCISQTGLTNFLMSSQHTLKILRLRRISPSELLWECPVLTNLTTLSVNAGQSCEYVFQGNHGHKFPALKTLNLSAWSFDPSTSSWSDDLFRVPSVTTIDLDCCTVNKDGIVALAHSFPNVIEIRLKSGYYKSDVWSVGAFKFLEKLKIWDYPVRRPSKNYMNMDSFLTGIPNAICNNLRQIAQPNLMDFQFNETLRESPSILKLKNLKQLIVRVQLHQDANLQLLEEFPLISMVSLWYALDMMPNLEARFVYEPNSPSWGYFEGGKDRVVTTLKAAFKHVHPHVKLESSFY